MIWIPIALVIIGLGLLFLRSFYRSKSENDMEYAYKYASLFNAAQIGYFICFIAAAVLFLIFLR